MALKKNKMFLVVSKTNGYGFVYAKNLTEAKNKLLEKYGEIKYNDFNWDSLVIGDQAEQIEPIYRSFKKQ